MRIPINSLNLELTSTVPNPRSIPACVQQGACQGLTHNKFLEGGSFILILLLKPLYFFLKDETSPYLACGQVLETAEQISEQGFNGLVRVIGESYDIRAWFRKIVWESIKAVNHRRGVGVRRVHQGTPYTDQHEERSHASPNHRNELPRFPCFYIIN